MFKDKIYLASPHMSNEGYEKEFIKEAFDTNWIAPLGANVNGFEKEICDYTGAKASAALSTGTAALHLAIKLAGLQKEDIVFCQDLTFSASANPIVYENCKPVFIDSETDTWNMSPVALERGFEIYPNAKAVIAVHLYGLAFKVDEIKAICKKHNAVLIEDSAESLGTLYKGQMTGTFGDFGVYSFNGNKIITTSGGGMLVSSNTNAEEIINRARFLSTQAREPERFYQHKEIGYNYRMSNIVAGIGRGQLKVIDSRIAQKRHIYEVYRSSFKDIDDIEMMHIHDEFERSNCWLSCILLNKKSKIKPLDLELALEKENIESRPIWKPMHLQPVFAECDYIDNGGIAKDIFDRGVCLPSDTKLQDSQLKDICKVIKSLWNK